MNEFIERQFSQIRYALSDFRNGEMNLNNFINHIEAIGRVIGDEFWGKSLFPIMLELEGINSELIDKKRNMTEKECEIINQLLHQIESITTNQYVNQFS